MASFCYGKGDICKPISVNKDEWKQVLQSLIISTIEQEEHLGKNLKKQCTDYLKSLFKNER